MKQSAKQNRFLAVLTMVALMAGIYGFAPLPKAANAVGSITDARDLLSDSDVSVSANHTLTFTPLATTSIGGYFEVVLPSATFGNILVGNITCPSNMTASAPNVYTARCTATAQKNPGVQNIIINGVTNPAAQGSQLINIYNYTDATTLSERVQVRVAIIEDVLMTATVDATLIFAVEGLAPTASSSDQVNGVNCTASTTATSTPFGTLAVGSVHTVCQQLKVTTNADDGFIVQVFQDQELTSQSGSNINSFDNALDNTGSSTPHAWVAPANILDAYHTYGHMGLTSEDATLSGGDTYGAALYVGFSTSTPVEVMYHTGPADGTTPDKGLTQVAYSTQISPLQEAGDYQNTLTYVATPTY
jgi:hypothetical protein